MAPAFASIYMFDDYKRDNHCFCASKCRFSVVCAYLYVRCASHIVEQTLFLLLVLASASTTVAASCLSGWVSASGDGLCLPCPVNTYASASGTECTVCPSGSYSWDRATSCTVVGAVRSLSGMVKKITASDGASGDSFGNSVSVSGNVAVIGAYVDDDKGSDSGSAYIFERTNGVWTQIAKLTASDGSSLYLFGNSVFVSGNVALIGALNSAYIFERTNGVWTQIAKLTASGGASGFGYSVSVSGNVAVIGASADDDKGPQSGSAYIFERTGGVWNETAKLTASDGAAYDRFGDSVSVSGNVAVIGAYVDVVTPKSGSAYIFERTGGVWSETAKLTASDGAAYDRFGGSVSVSGNVALIGAVGDDDKGSFSGSAYIFERTGGVWSQTAKLTASDGAAADWFGNSVSVSGNIAVIGAKEDNDKGSDSGSAYIFERTGGVWNETAKLTASDGAAYDRFGGSVSVSGNIAVIGAHVDDDKGSSSGSAYIWGCSGGTYGVASTCSTCQSGTWSAAGSPSCTDCAAGTYSMQLGATTCLSCPAGSYCAARSSLPAQCIAGTWSAAGSPSCTDCAAGTYNAQSGSSTCSTCPIGSSCASRSAPPTQCIAGTHNHLAGQTSCFQCPNVFRCTGGASCLIGYDGPLCGYCAVGYFVMDEECLPCPEVPVFLIVFVSIISIFVVIFVVVRIPPIVVARFKQLITFVQSVSLVMSINVEWPAFVEWVKSILSALYFDVDLASPECILGGGVNWHAKFLLALLIAGAVPLLIMILVGLIAVARRSYIRSGHRASTWPAFLALSKLQVRMSRLLFVVISIAYVPLTRTAVKAFVCVDSPVGVVLSGDTSILCGSAQHGLIQGVAGVVLFLVSGVLPIVLGLVAASDLIRHKGSKEGYRLLDRHEVLSALSESYHPSHAYFEGIVMVRKAILVVIVVAVPSGLIQSIVLSSIGVLYLIVVVILRPFAPVPITSKHKFVVNLMNHTEIACAAGVLLNSVVALILYFVPPTGPNAAVGVVVSVVVGVIGLSGISMLIIPVVRRKQKSTSVSPDIEKSTSGLGLDDPCNLLGKGDGRWLLALEDQLAHIIELPKSKNEKDNDTRMELIGALKVWIDRLDGRLSRRIEMLLLFHPDLSNTPSSKRTTASTLLNGVKLDTLKFRAGRKEASKRMSQADSLSSSSNPNSSVPTTPIANSSREDTYTGTDTVLPVSVSVSAVDIETTLDLEEKDDPQPAGARLDDHETPSTEKEEAASSTANASPTINDSASVVDIETTEGDSLDDLTKSVF